jgi:hypothetical protein
MKPFREAKLKDAERKSRNIDVKITDMELETQKGKDAMIEILQEGSCLGKIYKAFLLVPETRRMNQTQLSAYISATRETVSRNLWWCREILLMMYATDLEISKEMSK